jgi:chromosome segregation ATPase
VKDKLGLQNEDSKVELSRSVSRAQEKQDDSGGGGGAGGSGSGARISRKENGMGVAAEVDGEEVERLVLEEQWKNQKRQRELQSTLHALNEESMKTTRRLDDLYYTLLEKLSGLRSTINNLQELSGLTAQLHTHFREDTTELTSDLQRQIEAFGGFKAQQVKIETIDGRVRQSKSRADGLSERLEKARKRVSALEEREKEWQDSVNCVLISYLL